MEWNGKERNGMEWRPLETAGDLSSRRRPDDGWPAREQEGSRSERTRVKCQLFAGRVKGAGWPLLLGARAMAARFAPRPMNEPSRDGGRAKSANGHHCHAGPNCIWLAQASQSAPEISAPYPFVCSRRPRAQEAAPSARARANDSRCRRRRLGNRRVFIGTAPSDGAGEERREKSASN